MSTYPDRLVAQKGVYFLEVTTAHTGLKLAAIVINSDAVFTTLTITDGTTNHNALLTTSDKGLGQNLNARTVSAGMVLFAPVGFYYSAVTMSSGNAVGVIR